MRAVNKQLEEIKRVEKALENSKSIKFKKDQGKYLKRLKKELKEYCYCRGYNYQEILKRVVII